MGGGPLAGLAYNGVGGARVGPSGAGWGSGRGWEELVERGEELLAQGRSCSPVGKSKGGAKVGLGVPWGWLLAT